MKAKEDYLRAIYHFVEDGKDNVKSADIVDYLGLSKSSVSEMIKKLKKERLVEDKHYGAIELTKKGLVEAKAITKKHRVIELFLSEILKIDAKKIHNEAHKLEHSISDELLKAIEKLVDVETCPHGKPIP